MIININEYRVIYPLLKRWLNEHPNGDIEEYVTDLSAGTFVPLVALYYFVMEINGESQFILDKINMLKKFYDYDRIDGYKRLED